MPESFHCIGPLNAALLYAAFGGPVKWEAMKGLHLRGNVNFSTCLSLGLLVLLISCSYKEAGKNGFHGVWTSPESGWVLHIDKDSTYSYFHSNPLACIPFRSGPLTDFGTALKVSGDTLLLDKGVLTYRFLRSATLPGPCNVSLPYDQAADPIFNFEVFARTLSDHYAFMALNGIDWPGLYEQQRAKILEEPTELRLYEVLEETLELLGDNHGYLQADPDFYLRQQSSRGEPETPDESADQREYGDFEIANLVSKTFLSRELTEQSTLMRWGMFDEHTGYVQIKAMWLFAELEIPRSMIAQMGYVDAYAETFQAMDEGTYIEKEVEGVRKVMKQVMADLGGSGRIILDIRFNGGGQDAVSFEILSHFNDTRRKVALERLKGPDGLGPVQEVWLEAGDAPFLKPVYLLTSPQTGSAAETLALASLSLPHVRRVGTATSGALSTALEKKLPNGWDFALSNELFTDLDGAIYENRGIPVDIELDYPRGRQEFFRHIARDPGADLLMVMEAIRNLEE